MPERIQQILTRITDFWRNLSRRQKILIISAVAVVIIAAGVLVYVFTRPTMIKIATAENAEQAQSIQSLFEGEGISYEVSDDGMEYTINKKDEAAANILLGTNGIPSAGYSINDVLDGSFATTEADKKKKYQVYLEDRFSRQLETLGNIDDAEVNLSIPNDDGTLIADNQESYANVILTLHETDKMTAETATGIAQFIATGLGNESTANITILNQNGATLFAGGESTIPSKEEKESDEKDPVTENAKFKREQERIVADQVKKVFSTNNGSQAMYDNVEVGVNLNMNFDQTSSVDYNYYLNDENREEGYLDSRTEKTVTSAGGVGGTPGTDSNDDTTYVIEDGDDQSYNSTEVIEDRLPSEKITTTESGQGVTDYENSSVSVVAYNNVIYNEDQLKASGQLDDMTFEEFVSQNNNQRALDVDENVINAVANATGIPAERVSVLAYEVPMFQYSEESRPYTDILQIVLAVLIFALLGFVVFMTLRREEEEEVAEEVTVEELIEVQQQQEQEEEEEGLDDIGYSDKTEARILIENFVDEKPEAAAALLRNWLNEDWE